MKNIYLLIVVLGILGCSSDKEAVDKASLEINFQLKYDGEPIVMLEEYSYPDGRRMNFQKISMFLSNIRIATENGDEQLLSSVELLNFTESHSTLSRADEGLRYVIEDLDEGNYEELSFMIGLDSDQNASEPIDYTSDNPLSQTGEYWTSWDSYIFHKAEGRIDLDDNGSYDAEDVFALHVGSTELARELTKEINIELVDGSRSIIEIEIDMLDYFGRNEVYDIDSNSSLHSLSQIDAARVLADNFPNSFTVK